MSVAVVTDQCLPQVLELVRVDWAPDPRPTLRLFRNDFEPAPASEDVDFVEADWPGYTTFFLGGDLAAPLKAADGHWSCQSSQYEYQPPASGLGNTVYGWYVTRTGLVLAAQRFEVPLIMAPGSPPFRLQLLLYAKSESLFPPS